MAPPDASNPAAADDLRARLARALGDPGLRVAYWVEDEAIWLTEDGHPVDVDTGDPAVSVVERGGVPVAALMGERSREDGDPAETLTLATELELENARLHAVLRARLHEQEALRHVATAIVEQRTPDEIFAIVNREVAQLFEAGAASLVRYESGQAGTVMADWSAPGMGPLRPGQRLSFESDSALQRVFLTGAPARIDSYPDLDQSAVADWARAIGVHAAVAAPVAVDGRTWGAIGIATTRQRPFPRKAESRLAAFADLIAHAVANAEARNQLTASRIRIVQAADDARRRIERDLHDGAQQRLVAIALQLRMARGRVADIEATRAALDECAQELAVALDELRELARGIHPAVLTDHGLKPALEGVAYRSPVPVELDVTLAGRLDPGQEATLYFTASEAVANVAKYARASRIWIRTWSDERHVTLEVRDDGIGGADASHGSGLLGLADRVEAMGGRFDVESPEGEGTRLRARLPL